MQPQSSSRGGVVGEHSVFVGNLDPETSLADMEELLYELFLQVLPNSFLLMTSLISNRMHMMRNNIITSMCD